LQVTDTPETRMIPFLALTAGFAAEPDFDALLEASRDLSPRQFAKQLPPAKPPKLGFDVTEARFYDEVTTALSLTNRERALLAENGFVIVDHERRYTFGSMYYGIYAQDLPVLVTTDSILHAMHRTFDAVLMDLESQVLLPLMTQILADVHAELGRRTASMDPVPDRFRDVDLYLSVARELLTDLPVDTHVDHPARAAVLAGIRGADALQTPETDDTVLYGEPRMVDYTQFRPRGHYTRREPLKRYFRAMMWLGRADTGFELDHDRQVAAAATLSRLFSAADAEGDLEDFDTLMTWLVGESDNLGIPAMLRALDATQTTDADLDDPIQLAALRNALDGRQRIRSQVVVSDPSDPVEVAPPDLFQTFGQRFVIDSFVLSKVVFDSILYRNQKVKRMMPSGLDVAAALGNDAAARWLVPSMATHPYAADLHAARRFVAEQPSGFWSSSVYNTWLGALRTLTVDRLDPSLQVPQAMRSEAWERKQTQTQLASWAELRHDTVLYAKQSYTAFPSCEYPAGYVEPYPAFYEVMRSFAWGTAEALRGFEPERTRGGVQAFRARVLPLLDRWDEPLRILERLAGKELEGKPFSPAEKAFLKKTIDIRGGGSGPPRYDGWYPMLFADPAEDATKWFPEIADVHTDPQSSSVLQVGVGDVDFLVMAVDNERDTAIYVGPSYAYYEFVGPAAARMTDETWGSRFHQGDLPPRPEWIQPVLGDSLSRDLPR
jgi:hypothetical protein